MEYYIEIWGKKLYTYVEFSQCMLTNFTLHFISFLLSPDTEITVLNMGCKVVSDLHFSFPDIIYPHTLLWPLILLEDS